MEAEYGLEDAELDEVWSSIIVNQGSVQHLEFLSDIHKQVFKTSFELDQSWIIEHAAVRQPFICQGQSVNIFVRPDVHKNDLHKLHFDAWKKGLKALYYCRSKPIKPTEIISTPVKVTTYTLMAQMAEENLVSQNIDYSSELAKACLSCEG